MTHENIQDERWQVQKVCTDIEDYELSIERQKTDWTCEQNHECWKWLVSYHGSIVASGAGNSLEEAKGMALGNTPMNEQGTDANT